MLCKKCKFEFPDEYKFCPNCAQKNDDLDISNNQIEMGNDNINYGVGNSGYQNFNIGNTYNYKTDDFPIVEYELRYDRRILGGVKGFKIKYQITSVLSIVSAIITIVGFLGDIEILHLFIIILLGLLINTLDSIEKYKKLSETGEVYENENLLYQVKDGEVYKISRFGICPICGGRVNIYKDEKLKRKLGKCVNNEEHLYTYDPTINRGEAVIFTFFTSWFNMYKEWI